MGSEGLGYSVFPANYRLALKSNGQGPCEVTGMGQINDRVDSHQRECHRFADWSCCASQTLKMIYGKQKITFHDTGMAAPPPSVEEIGAGNLLCLGDSLHAWCDAKL